MIILIGLAIVSLILKIVFKEVLYHTRKERIIINLIIFVTMMSWEVLSHILNVWIYPGPGMIGIYIYGLPLELFVFYLVLPDFVFTVYELIRHKLGKSYINKRAIKN
mgnify:CR=1 FL=1